MSQVESLTRSLSLAVLLTAQPNVRIDRARRLPSTFVGICTVMRLAEGLLGIAMAIAFQSSHVLLAVS